MKYSETFHHQLMYSTQNMFKTAIKNSVALILVEKPHYCKIMLIKLYKIFFFEILDFLPIEHKLKSRKYNLAGKKIRTRILIILITRALIGTLGFVLCVPLTLLTFRRRFGQGWPSFYILKMIICFYISLLVPSCSTTESNWFLHRHKQTDDHSPRGFYTIYFRTLRWIF